MDSPTSPTASDTSLLALRRERFIYHSPADIKRLGVARFLAAVAPAEPLPIPDLGFTAEENARMDELLKQEREAKRGF